MIGNLSKSKGFKGDKGDAFKFEDFTPEQLESIRGYKGDMGYTPKITFRYDSETGDLYCNSDGILLDKEYIESNDVATKEFVTEKLLELVNKAAPTPASITLYAGKWKKGTEGNMWYQVVNVENATVTEYSKIDLQPSPEQLCIFHEKDMAFVTLNENGVVIVFCIGQKPTNDYTLQATVMEVTIDA